MIKSYFDNMVDGIEKSLASGDASARKRYALSVARLGSRLYSGKDKVAWCGVTAPFDLLNSMGVTSCFVEFIGAMLAGMGAADPLLGKIEDAGYGPDTCAYHRAVIAAAKDGMMPVPDFLVATSAPCTGGLAVMETLAREFSRDLFVLHIPQTDDPDSVSYLADQLRELTDFVAFHTKVPFDMEKLRAASVLTNQARKLMVDAYRLAAAKPSPVAGKTLNNFGVVVALLLGTQEAVDVCKAFRDDFAQKVAEGVGGVPGEKLRLLWIQNRIQFKNDIVDYLENEWGAVVVADELNAVTFGPIDPDDPFPGIARRSISIPLNGSVDRRMDNLLAMCRDYAIDGAINPCHWGCRQGTGASAMIATGLKAAGVPVLNMDVDCIDRRNFAPGQIKTRLEAFIEMLSENKGV